MKFFYEDTSKFFHFADDSCERNVYTTGQGPPKGLHFLIQSSSLKQRRLVFRDLEAYFRAEGNAVPEAAVKGVCRLLALTLPRYHDSESRALVRRFVKFICDVGGVSGFKQVASALADVAASYTNSGNMSASVARAPLAALNWTVSVIESSVPRDQVPPECYSSLHDSQAKLYACVVSSVDAGLIKRTQKALGGAWKRRPDELSRLHSTAPSWSRSLSGLVFGSFALSQMQQQADPEPEQMEKLKESLLSSFVDLVVSSKSPVPPFAVSPGCTFLLASVTSQEVFSRSLLPPLLKAILRNPEVVMGTLGTVLGTLTIDLSPYALQIGKPVAASLNSKLDQTREEAWGCLRVLASACSEGEAVKGLFLFLEKVYHGTSDVGKLLGPPQKHSTLKALGSLSSARIPSSAFCALSDSVVGAFSKILENEVHEGSLTLALQMLSLWGQRMTVEVPTSMTKLLLKGPKLKSSTPVVRCEYLRLMDAVFDTSSLFPQAEPLIPQLGQAVDKGAQAGAQMFVVTEALLSCTLLERLAAALPAADAQAASCRKLSDSPKAPFYAEKYLLQAPSYAFPHVVGLIETILARGSGSAEALAPPLALALCLSAPGKCARASSRLLRIVSLSDGAAVLPLCRALANLLLQHKVSAASEAPSSGGDEAACSLRLGSWFGAVQLLAQALKSPIKERRAQAALELLAALHDPLVASVAPPIRRLWDLMTDALSDANEAATHFLKTEEQAYQSSEKRCEQGIGGREGIHDVYHCQIVSLERQMSMSHVGPPYQQGQKKRVQFLTLDRP
ncbi:unnamed protein product [Cyprideis torosa]|uniref:Stalled ribosome sensor GCN1-like N-terminal domain-containing protein n=1 Tax=Cyprideis torosa TaxID=163714 RepID=A0A7R8WLZ9_9CRUS|nr:unnamed protein product [Cyprideis torosa]CAG0903077.1 unnamed protein product [Cyprideis torosa]